MVPKRKVTLKCWFVIGRKNFQKTIKSEWLKVAWRTFVLNWQGPWNNDQQRKNIFLSKSKKRNKHLCLGRGGSHVFSVLAVYSDDASSNPIEAYNYP